MRLVLISDICLAVVAWGYLPFAYVVPRIHIAEKIFCPFRHVTGLSCPFCGMSRSIGNLLRGDMSVARHYHEFGPILLIAWGLLICLSSYWFWCDTRRFIAIRKETLP